MLNILDFHGNDSPTEELEEVVILPYDDTRLATSGSFTFPDGEWDDFDHIIAELSISGTWHGSAEVQKERIVSAAYGSVVFRVEYTASNTSYVQRIYKDSATTGSWNIITGGSTCSVLQIKGYKKRYATKNSAKEIILSESNTTGGVITSGSISTLQRYTLDIASVLGAEYVGKKLIIKTEIFNNSGVGDADWFELADESFYDGSGNAWRHGGVITDHTATTIRIATAGYGGRYIEGTDIARLHWGDYTNTAGTNSTIASAPCRITVWTVEQYVTNNTLDLITSLEARIAALENA